LTDFSLNADDFRFADIFSASMVISLSLLVDYAQPFSARLLDRPRGKFHRIATMLRVARAAFCP